MLYDKLIYKLTWDTNIETLRRYLSGDKTLPIKNKLQIEAIKKLIPLLIEKQEEENKEFIEDFMNSKLTKLAIFKLQEDNTKRRKKYFGIDETIKTMYKIINKAWQSSNNENIIEMLQEYLQG